MKGQDTQFIDFENSDIKTPLLIDSEINNNSKKLSSPVNLSRVLNEKDEKDILLIARQYDDVFLNECSNSNIQREYSSTSLDTIDELLNYGIEEVKLDVSDQIAQTGRQFAKRHQERLIFKDGSSNYEFKHVSKKRFNYLTDLFTTLLDMKWRYNLVIFVFAFVGSWFVFAFGWWLIALLRDEQSEKENNDNLEPCVSGVDDFVTALLFSIETQQTIGYGTRAINLHCNSGLFLLIIQACFGILLQSLMTGIVFSKLARPKHRAHTMMFSRFAVICQRDDEYCLLFRVGDLRRSYIIGAQISALFIKSSVVYNNKEIPLVQHDLELETERDRNDNSVLLIWPLTVVHRITKTSPLWNLAIKDLFIAKFEIIIILEGTIEQTGMSTQFRTSYLPSEILWGHHLAPLLTFQKSDGKYEIDFTQFDNVTKSKYMPDCSAKEYSEQLLARRVSPAMYFHFAKSSKTNTLLTWYKSFKKSKREDISNQGNSVINKLAFGKDIVQNKDKKIIEKLNDEKKRF